MLATYFRLALLFCAVCSVIHASPAVINYQGRLTNSAGVPVHSAVTITFSFWNAETGGTQIDVFADADTITPDENGIYSTLIGDEPGLPIPENVFDREDVFLNVNINGENLLPRKRLTSVGYALNSSTVLGGEVGRLRFTAMEPLQAGNLLLLNDLGQVYRARYAGSDTVTSVSEELYNGKLQAMEDGKVLLMMQDRLYLITTDAQLRPQLSAPVTFQPAATSSYYFITRLTPTQALISYANPADNKSMLREVTITGQNLTLGPAIVLGDAYFISSEIIIPHGIVGVGPAKFIVRLINSTEFVVGTISGSNVTLGTPLNYTESGMFARGINLLPLAEDKAIFLGEYENVMAPWVIKLRVLQVSGTSLSFLGEISGTASGHVDYQFQVIGPDLVVTDFQNPGGMYSIGSGGPVAAGVLGTAYQTTTFTPLGNGKVFHFGPSGSGTFALMQPSVGLTNANQLAIGPNYYSAARLSETSALIMGSDGPRTVFKTVLNTAGNQAVDFSRFIGVAEESGATGEEIIVTIPGGITSQFSNLKPGANYVLTEAGLTTGSLSQSIAKALTPDKLLIR